jgi:hypothetical protein
MTHDQLSRAVNREPFLPFTLVLVAGGWKEYYVPDRDSIELSEGGVIVREEHWGERWIDPRLIAAIEFRGFPTRKPEGGGK